MGATLVAHAIGWAPFLSDRAFRVLVAMALTAKDSGTKDTPPRLYFAGQAPLVRVLAQKKGGTFDSGIKTVKRAIDELSRKGAIRCTQPAIKNSNATYELTLDNDPQIDVDESKGSTNPLWITGGRGDTTSPPGRDTTSPPGWTTDVPPGGTLQVPPCKEPLEEPLEELKEDEGVDLRPQLALVRDPAHANNPQDSSPQCPNPQCVLGYEIDTKSRCPNCNPPPREFKLAPAPTAAIGDGPRCDDHGLKGGTRDDGQPHCPICRRLNGKAG